MLVTETEDAGRVMERPQPLQVLERDEEAEAEPGSFPFHDLNFCTCNMRGDKPVSCVRMKRAAASAKS